MRFDASLIICTYNQSEILGHILQAVSEDLAGHNYNIQLIIADDGSKVEEVGNFLSLTAKYNNSSKCRIKYAWQEDLGFQQAASRNNGLRLAESEVIIFIDGDCIPDAGFLKAHIEAHQRNEKVICVGHRKFDHPDNLGRADKVPLSDEFSLRERSEEQTIKNAIVSAHPWKAVHGRNFSFARPNPTHFFEEDYQGWGCEDTTFAIDLYKDGYRIVFEKEAAVTQYDDFSSSQNPYLSLSSKSIAGTIGNYLMLMRKYRNDPVIFTEVAGYLGKYAVPFNFDGKDYVLSEERKASFFGRKSGFTYEEALNLYLEAMTILEAFYSANPQLQMHPVVTSKDKKPTQEYKI